MPSVPRNLVCQPVAWLLLTCFSCLGCGDALELKKDQLLVIAMTGVFSEPEDATGDSEPKFQSYTLKDASLTDAESGDVIDIYDADPKAFRILSRTQIIHEYKIADYVGKTFSRIDVAFDPTVEGQGKSGEALTTTLATPILSLTAALVVEKAKSQRLSITVQWKNTVTSAEASESGVESMSPPTFSLDLSDN